MTAAAARRRPVSAFPVVPWGELRAGMDWRQGEHVTLIGPTGCGKTTLAIGLLPMRQYVVALGTKPKDPTLQRLVRDGYRLVRSSDEWPPPMVDKRPAWPRVVFWPRLRSTSDVPHQGAEIGAVMGSIFRSGGWCVLADELRYVTQYLGLQQLAELYWLQGRSIGISFVTCAQRPAWVPLEAYSQATHLVLWRNTDKRDLMRLSEIGGVDVAAVRHEMERNPDAGGLGKHDFLYLNTRTGYVARSIYRPER